jgi:hypothetical protein
MHDEHTQILFVSNRAWLGQLDSVLHLVQMCTTATCSLLNKQSKMREMGS